MEQRPSKFGDTRIIYPTYSSYLQDDKEIIPESEIPVCHVSCTSHQVQCHINSGTSTHQDVRKDLTSSLICIQMVEIRHLHEEHFTATPKFNEPSGSRIRMDICPFYISNKPSSRYLDVQMAPKRTSWRWRQNLDLFFTKENGATFGPYGNSGEVSAPSPDQYSPIVGVDKLSSKVHTIRARVNC